MIGACFGVMEPPGESVYRVNEVVAQINAKKELLDLYERHYPLVADDSPGTWARYCRTTFVETSLEHYSIRTDIILKHHNEAENRKKVLLKQVSFDKRPPTCNHYCPEPAKSQSVISRGVSFNDNEIGATTPYMSASPPLSPKTQQPTEINHSAHPGSLIQFFPNYAPKQIVSAQPLSRPPPVAAVVPTTQLPLESSSSSSSNSARELVVCRFPIKLVEMLKNPNFRNVICYDEKLSALILLDHKRLAEDVLPEQANTTSKDHLKLFHRQLNHYGFKTIRRLSNTFSRNTTLFKNPDVTKIDDILNLRPQRTRRHTSTIENQAKTTDKRHQPHTSRIGTTSNSRSGVDAVAASSTKTMPAELTNPQTLKEPAAINNHCDHYPMPRSTEVKGLEYQQSATKQFFQVPPSWTKSHHPTSTTNMTLSPGAFAPPTISQHISSLQGNETALQHPSSPHDPLAPQDYLTHFSHVPRENSRLLPRFPVE